MTIQNDIKDKKIRTVRFKLILAVVTALLVTVVMLFLAWDRTANPQSLWPKVIWLLLILFAVVGGIRGLKRKADKSSKNTNNNNKWT
ncbi:MAG TPA: hypothetical protein VNF48_00540 [Gammaproteobacteria bacterium]|nr:hypothetical protein [Gammaproteobacteria bacterium]